jgi:UDP-glucuronate 4-epimerase
MNNKRETILITGCAGFIGSKISEELLRSGNIVMGVDNLNNSYSVMLKKWRLDKLQKHDDFQFEFLDITHFDEIKGVFQKYNFDSVVNLAARAGVRSSVRDPKIYFETNILGVLNILELCREFGVKKLVQASTSGVYGESDLPLSEDKCSDYPLSPYAASKKGAEALAYSYHYLYGIDITIPRYFTVYGPAGRPDMAILKFIHNIHAELPIKVYGDGNQQRDFTYIDDIANGSIAALKPLGFEIINLGSDCPIKLSFVIELIEEFLEKKAQIKFHIRHPADVRDTWAHIDKAKNILGWIPEVKIEKGVLNTVEWYMENREWLIESKVFEDCD